MEGGGGLSPAPRAGWFKGAIFIWTTRSQALRPGLLADARSAGSGLGTRWIGAVAVGGWKGIDMEGADWRSPDPRAWRFKGAI